MNARIVLVLTAAMAAPVAVPASAQDAFEGVVTFQVNAGPAGQQSLTYSIKGDKLRMDMATGGMEMFTLFDRATRKVDMVVPISRMYMERTVEDAQAMADEAASGAEVEWTGSKETIAGYECEHATVTAGGGTTDVCLAKGLGMFMPMQDGLGRPGAGGGGGGGATGEAWQGHIGQGFPLKVVHDGEVQMVATRIEKKELDDALFSVPDGYRKMSMPGGGSR